jgi:F-type H+-transporting ATPase subunit a
VTAYRLRSQVGPLGLLSAEKAEHGDEGYILVPFLRAATTDLNLPLGLAIISMTYVQIVGIRALGLGYFRKFFVNPIRDLLGSFVGLLELVSEFAKIISLTFRLFGNIFAGQVLLFVIPFLLPFLIPLPFYGLEMFVGFMQAFVFAILTLVFSSQAVLSHEGHSS